MKKMVLGVALMASAGLAQAAQAQQGFNQNNLYFGGGLGSNDFDNIGGRSTGFQFFGGYKLDMIDLGAVKSAVEVGYMDTGSVEDSICTTVPGFPPICVTAKASASGVWANYVASYPMTPKIDAIGRIGLDFGDDDGFMFGIGAGFNVAPQLDIRGEYVVRQHINSLQANVVYYLK